MTVSLLPPTITILPIWQVLLYFSYFEKFLYQMVASFHMRTSRIHPFRVSGLNSKHTVLTIRTFLYIHDSILRPLQHEKSMHTQAPPLLDVEDYCKRILQYRRNYYLSLHRIPSYVLAMGYEGSLDRGVFTNKISQRHVCVHSNSSK